MNLYITRALRRQLRRALLGSVLVLHVGWLALGAVPAHAAMVMHARATVDVSAHDSSADAAEAASMAVSMPMDDASMPMPCHADAMSMTSAAPTAPAAPHHYPAPAHLPCCAQGGCVCTVGAMLLPALPHGRPGRVQVSLPPVSSALPTGRSPAPELRPPIHA